MMTPGAPAPAARESRVVAAGDVEISMERIIDSALED
jgi:hypothetical protein